MSRKESVLMSLTTGKTMPKPNEKLRAAKKRLAYAKKTAAGAEKNVTAAQKNFLDNPGKETGSLYRSSVSSHIAAVNQIAKAEVVLERVS